MSTPRTYDVVRRVLVAVFVVAVFVWLGARIWRDIGHVEWAAVTVRIWPLLAAVGVLACAYLLRAAVWAMLVRSLGASVAPVDAIRVFILTFAGRYLPGKIWQFVGAGVIGLRYAIPVSLSVGSSLLGVLIHESIGLVIGFVCVGSTLGYPAWLYLVAPAGLAAVLFVVCTPVLSRVSVWGGRVLGRTVPILTPLSPSRAALLILSYACVWGLFGAGFLCLAHALVPAAADSLTLVTATGAITCACVLGFFAVFAPSGLGVREAILAVLLGPVVGDGAAALLALAARVWMTVVEILVMGWAVVPFLRIARSAPTGENAP